MSERNDMVHLINPDGTFAGAMTREDFEDACALGEAMKALFMGAGERIEESLAPE